MTNVEISGNTANEDGGGMHNDYNSSSTLTNVTIAGNTPEAIYINNDSSLSLNNAIVWGDIIEADGSYVATNSLIEGNTNTENGNIDAAELALDDIFNNPANGDYTLADTSPAINVGSNQLLAEALYGSGGSLSGAEVDLAGNPRLFNGTIDMGAYENQNTPPVAICQNITVELDENGTVSITAQDIDNGSSDAEGTVTLSIDITEFDCEDIGENTVTLTVTDSNDVSVTCEATVTVEDNLAPVPDTEELDEITMECEVWEDDITAPTATDNCSGTVIVSNDATFPITENTTITWTFEDENGNESTQTQNLIVLPSPIADVELNDVTVTYDGNLHQIEVENLPADASVSYSIDPETASDNGAINVGTYEITAIVTPPSTAVHCEDIELTATLVIEEADFVGITFEDEEFTYDGTEHSIAVSGAPEDATITYTNNGQINAGTYEVTALIQIENYTALELTANLIINKAQAVITAEDVQEYIYDGTLKDVLATLTHTETTLVYTPQQGYTNVGTYEIEVHADETQNYSAVSKEVILIINEANFEGITFENAAFTYDGNEHSIAVSGAPDDATVTYTNNEQINAGTYEVTALIQMDNYTDLELTADLIINKAQAEITADDVQEHIYDGTIKNVSASLNHSETTLNYAPQQGYTNSGTYEIEVSADETPNYLAVSKDVTLIISEAGFDGITFEDAEFTYDGTEHLISVSGAPSEATVTYTNNGQINAGTYEVTALIQMDNYSDLELTADLIINKAQAIITADEEQHYLYDGTVKNVEATLNHAETELQYIPQQGYTEIGVYEITIQAGETQNYLETSKIITLIIDESLSVKDISDYEMKLVPNPAYSGKFIQIHAGFPQEELKNMQIRIFSLAGELIKEIKSDQAITEIRLPESMTSATYIVQVNTGKHFHNLKLLVK